MNFTDSYLLGNYSWEQSSSTDLFKQFLSQHEEQNSSDFDFQAIATLLWKLHPKRRKENFELFVDNLNVYFIPVIIIFGLCGNMLSALVFTCTHLRRLSSSLYLTWLSLADVGFLIALGIAWLDRVGVNWLTTNGCCQVVVYLTRVCGFLSVWFVLSFTMERYIIVYHALQKDILCTKYKAKIVIGSLCGLSLLMYIYVFFTYDVISVGPRKSCGPIPEYQNIMTVMSSIDTAVACVIPSLAILILNAKIIYKLHKFQNQRFGQEEVSTLTGQMNGEVVSHKGKSVMHASISHAGSMKIKFSKHDEQDANVQELQRLNVVPTDNCQKIIRCRSQLRTARMLLILSSVFVVLNLPSHVFRVHAFMTQLLWDNIKTPRMQYKVHEFFEIFFFLNFAINFFIYSVCGKQFRTGLRRLSKRMRYWITKNGRIFFVRMSNQCAGTTEKDF